MAKKRKKPKIEFRYYQMSEGSPILALLGQKWVQTYGRGVNYLHFHNYLEIGYCYGGQGHMILGEDKVFFNGGEFTVIPPNYAHTTNSEVGTVSKWEYLFIDVEGFMKKILDSPVKAEKMIQRIYSRALFFLAEIARMNRQSEEDRMEEETGKVTNMITRALDYVSYYYMEDIRVEDLAKYCHISETHFRRVFTSYMKVSPLEYVNTVRIQTACELLKKTDEPVADIAHKCGFTTNSTFNRNFKHLMGVTPVEWRKRPENYEQQLLNFNIHSEKGW